MNWHQLLTTATPEERELFATLALQRIEARRARRIWVHGKQITDRRQTPHLRAHWIAPNRRANHSPLHGWRLPALHFVTTLAITAAYPPQAPAALLALTWAASLGVTTLLWGALLRVGKLAV